MSAVGALLNNTVVGAWADDDGSDDDAAPLAPPTLLQCQTAAQSGCCFASLLEYSFSAVQAQYLQAPQVSAFQSYGWRCQAQFGIGIASQSCNGTQPSACQAAVTALSPLCLQFMMDLNGAIANITTVAQNAAVCQHTCLPNVTAALSALVSNGLRTVIVRCLSQTIQGVRWSSHSTRAQQTCLTARGLPASSRRLATTAGCRSRCWPTPRWCRHRRRPVARLCRRWDAVMRVPVASSGPSTSPACSTDPSWTPWRPFHSRAPGWGWGYHWSFAKARDTALPFPHSEQCRGGQHVGRPPSRCHWLRGRRRRRCAGAGWLWHALPGGILVTDVPQCCASCECGDGRHQSCAGRVSSPTGCCRRCPTMRRSTTHSIGGGAAQPASSHSLRTCCR